MGLGVPVKLLHEAVEHVVTVELKTGELYRGTMTDSEHNWNCVLENVTFTATVLSYALSNSFANFIYVGSCLNENHYFLGILNILGK